jgi:RHS repeat-associated protein
VRLPYTHTRFPNGIVSDYTYDQLNRLEDLTQFRDADDDGIFDAGEDLVAQYAYILLANGRRSGVTETDDDANTTQIDWFYYDLGRLTREVYDSSVDDTLDFAADYLFDLVGNRHSKLTDHQPSDMAAYRSGGAMSADETVSYDYDANDRLLTETKDADGTANDRHTVYGYDATQQTSKNVYTDNTLTTPVEKTNYAYNLQGRMSSAEIDSDGNGDLEDRIEYEYDANGIRVAKTVTSDSNSDGDLSDEPPPKIFAYDTYGNPIGFDPAAALTTLLYNSEQLDKLTGLQYLRARYYDQATGRFNRLDPFAGNMRDPRSLHKYLYVHGDPIMGIALRIAAWTTVAAIAAYVAWSYLDWTSFDQRGHPAARLARGTGVGKIRAVQRLYENRQHLTAGSLRAADLSLGVDAAVDLMIEPIYEEADLGAVFDEYASFPHRAFASANPRATPTPSLLSSRPFTLIPSPVHPCNGSFSDGN